MGCRSATPPTWRLAVRQQQPHSSSNEDCIDGLAIASWAHEMLREGMKWIVELDVAVSCAQWG